MWNIKVENSIHTDLRPVYISDEKTKRDQTRANTSWNDAVSRESFYPFLGQVN